VLRQGPRRKETSKPGGNKKGVVFGLQDSIRLCIVKTWMGRGGDSVVGICLLEMQLVKVSYSIIIKRTFSRMLHPSDFQQELEAHREI
jgi:hypothetical protein